MSVTNKKAAAKALRDLKAKVEAGGPARDNTATFGTYAQGWINATLEVSSRKRSTKNLYASLTRTHIVPSALGRTPLDKLTPPTVERFITDLRRKGLAPSSVRQIYTIGRTIDDTAIRDRHLTSNPFAVVPRPKATTAESQHLTGAEVDAVLDAADGTRYAPLFELLVGTGLRRGEALALKWRDVNLTDIDREKPKVPAMSAQVCGTLARQGGELVVTAPKSAKSVRTMPLTPDVIAVLRAVKTRTAEDRLRAGSKWHDTGFVFVTEFGEPCDPRNALRAFTVAAGRAGVEGVGLHTLRHTAATIMLNNGVPIAVVSKLLGHSSIQVTVDTYGHADDESSRAAVDVLAEALLRRSRQA